MDRSEYLVIVVLWPDDKSLHTRTIQTFRCNREHTAMGLKSFFDGQDWVDNTLVRHDPPKIGLGTLVAQSPEPMEDEDDSGNS